MRFTKNIKVIRLQETRTKVKRMQLVANRPVIVFHYTRADVQLTITSRRAALSRARKLRIFWEKKETLEYNVQLRNGQIPLIKDSQVTANSRDPFV